MSEGREGGRKEGREKERKRERGREKGGFEAMDGVMAMEGAGKEAHMTYWTRKGT